MKKAFLAALALVSAVTAHAQKLDGPQRVEDNGYYVQRNYVNGVVNGPFFRFNHVNGKLEYFGEKKDGKLCGTLFYFDDNGYPVMKFTDFKDNTASLRRVGMAKTPDRTCQSTTYYSNGKLKSEGMIIYFEDEDPVVGEEYGEWKYYDENGEFTHSREYK